MVPAYSVKVSRVLTYSGSCCAISHFVYGALTLSGRSFQDRSTILDGSRAQSEPRSARTPVWALPLSLAATYGIDVSFSSSGYLDVSVHRVPFHNLWIQLWMTGVLPAGFPHSDICGSMDICSSPQLFAAYHVFRRLLVPRHPPCALLCINNCAVFAQRKRRQVTAKQLQNRTFSIATKRLCKAIMRLIFVIRCHRR